MKLKDLINEEIGKTAVQKQLQVLGFGNISVPNLEADETVLVSNLKINTSTKNIGPLFPVYKSIMVDIIVYKTPSIFLIIRYKVKYDYSLSNDEFSVEFKYDKGKWTRSH